MSEGRPFTNPEIARFEEFTREELPRHVRQQLEILLDNELQPAEERLASQVVDIVRNRIQSFFRSSRQGQGLDTPREDEIDNGEGPSSRRAITLGEEYPSVDELFNLDSLPQFFNEPPPDISQYQDELQFSVNGESKDDASDLQMWIS